MSFVVAPALSRGKASYPAEKAALPGIKSGATVARKRAAAPPDAAALSRVRREGLGTCQATLAGATSSGSRST